MKLWLICFMTVFLAEAYGDSEPEPQDTFVLDDEKSINLDMMLRGRKGGKGKSCNCKVLESKLDQILGLIQNGDEPAVSTCKEIYDRDPSSGNKAYQLEVGSATENVYCHMTELGACGGGGWTLVMKTDGTKDTFNYDSIRWTNKKSFNLPGGETGLDFQETKLPTYWNTPFTKICLGMKIPDQDTRYIVIDSDEEADSLYSLIADGEYRETSLGRGTWKSLIGSKASLQTNCNREGFNARCSRSPSSKARIGILGNNENDCSNCDSRIGFGATGSPDNSNTCGNEAAWAPDNGDRHIKAMGYIFVQ